MQDIRLTATARVNLPTPVHYLDKLTDHFAEHGDVVRTARRGQIALSYGTATIEADEESLFLHAESTDETGLAYMKYSIAEHVIEFARHEQPKIVWAGHGSAGSPCPISARCRSFRQRASRRICGGCGCVARICKDLPMVACMCGYSFRRLALIIRNGR